MHDDDEGEIIDCKVVHGFRWYKLRVTTRAVSTEVRVKPNTLGKARGRQGGGGDGRPRGVKGATLVSATLGVLEVACLKDFRFLLAEHEQVGRRGLRRTWLSPE